MTIIESVSKQYSWNNCNKSLLSSLAIVCLWQDASTCSRTCIISASWVLNKLDSPERILRALWWQPSEEKKKKKAWLWTKENKYKDITDKVYVKWNSQRMRLMFKI